MAGSSSGSALIPVGIALAVFASMTGTIGKQLLRFSEINKQRGNAYVAKVSLTIGLALNTAVGPIVDMMSYMFAPQSLIAPLGGLDVVWNTLIAPCTLGEKLTKTVIFGVVLIAGGATGTTAFGNHEDKDYNLDMMKDIFIRKTVAFYLGSLVVWLLFNILFLQPRSSAPKGEPWASGDPIRGLSLGMTAGSIAGNMFCVKAFIELLQASIRDDEPEIWAHWLPYVMLLGAILFAVTNLWFLTKAMREYQALFMGAVFEGSLICCACVSGMVVYSDLEYLSWYQIGIYWTALCSIVAGILVVAYGCFRPDDEEEMKQEMTATETQEVSGSKSIDTPEKEISSPKASDARKLRLECATDDASLEQDPSIMVTMGDSPDASKERQKTDESPEGDGKITSAPSQSTIRTNTSFKSERSMSQSFTAGRFRTVSVDTVHSSPFGAVSFAAVLDSALNPKSWSGYSTRNQNLGPSAQTFGSPA